MIYNKLIFKSKRCNHHDNIFNATIKIKRFEIFESNRRWNVFNWRRDVVLSKADDIEHIVILRFRYIILSRLKIKSLVSIVKDDSNSKHSFDLKVDNNNEEKIVESNNFAIDIIVVTKAFFFCDKKFVLKSQRNRRWKIKKQQSKSLTLFDQDSNDSMNIVMIEATFFCVLIDLKDKKQEIKCFLCYHQSNRNRHQDFANEFKIVKDRCYDQRDSKKRTNEIHIKTYHEANFEILSWFVKNIRF